MRYYWQIGNFDPNLINVYTWKSGFHYLAQTDDLYIDGDSFPDLVQLVNTINLLHEGNVVKMKNEGYKKIGEINSITIFSKEHPSYTYYDFNKHLLNHFISKFSILYKNDEGGLCTRSCECRCRCGNSVCLSCDEYDSCDSDGDEFYYDDDY